VEHLLRLIATTMTFAHGRFSLLDRPVRRATIEPDVVMSLSG
jgi:hypothetical protein